MIAVVSVVSVLAVVVFSHLLDRNEKSGEEATMTSLNETPSDRFIITYTEGSRASQAINSAQTYGTNVLDTLPAEDRDAINRAASTVSATVEGVSAHSLSTVGVDLDVELTSEQVGQFVAAFGGDTGVEAVEPELHMTLLGENAPNDEYYSYQWDMASDGYGVDAEDAWSHSTGKGVTVAVVDTGVLTDHPDLRDQVVPGYDFISDPSRSHDGDGRDADPYDAGDNVVAEECGAGSPATDSSWHGSHVAGTIAASTNNSTGVSGVAPDAKVLPVRVLGSCGGTGTDIIDALTWVSGGHVNGVPDNENPAQVINMSLGGPGFCPVYYQRAIDAAVERGSVVVVAAGNEDVDASMDAPANCSNVITVGASDGSGTRSSYSNYGSTVTVSAPGGDLDDGGIVSTVDASLTSPEGPTYGTMVGTSQATPHVAGTIALLLALDPELKTPDLVSLLQATSTSMSSCDRDSCGAGIINSAAAVNAQAAKTPADPAPEPSPEPSPDPTPEPEKGFLDRLRDLVKGGGE